MINYRHDAYFYDGDKDDPEYPDRSLPRFWMVTIQQTDLTCLR